ncbi:MAG: hypothetical protein ABIG60_02655 [Patescibacteria group bacterium]
MSKGVNRYQKGLKITYFSKKIKTGKNQSVISGLTASEAVKPLFYFLALAESPERDSATMRKLLLSSSSQAHKTAAESPARCKLGG